MTLGVRPPGGGGRTRQTSGISRSVLMQTGHYPIYNRRHFLRHMAGMSAMALPGLHFVEGLRADAPTLKKDQKSLIILWMSGGPSHMDTWDLKYGQSTGGEFKPAPTAV